MHHVPSYLEKPDDTFIPSKVVQPVSELKIDITSLETIDSEWAKSIPSRLLQKLYVVHKKNVTLYRGIDVRPGMIFFSLDLSCSIRMQLPAIKILGPFEKGPGYSFEIVANNLRPSR